MKLLTKRIRERLLQNGRIRQCLAAGGKAEAEFLPVVKLFTPDGSATWLLTELYPGDPEIAFGLCDLGLGMPELGTVSLAELEAAREQLGLAFERDVHSAAEKTLSAYDDAARRLGRIDA